MSAASEVLPPALVRLVVAEMTVMHMALFRWGGPADVSADARAFTYHKHLSPLCATLLILSAIEIAIYHLLVGHWSRTAALVMFVLSDVGFVYLAARMCVTRRLSTRRCSPGQTSCCDWIVHCIGARF